MINAVSFIQDYPEFSDQTRYPPSAINYWGAVANLLLANPSSMSFWDRTPGGFVPPPLPPTLSTVLGGTLAAATALAVTAYVTPHGMTTPSGFAQIAVPAGSLLSIAAPAAMPHVIGWNAYTGTEFGHLVVQNAAPLLLGVPWTEPETGMFTSGSPPPEYNTSGPKNMLEVGVELFVAHNLALEVQAQDAARVSAVPGTVAGPIVSRGANGVNVSYDASSGVEKDAGHWNMTTYGRRLHRLFMMVGAVPIQIGVGVDPTGGMNGPGWSGPPPFVIGSPGSAIY